MPRAKGWKYSGDKGQINKNYDLCVHEPHSLGR